MLDINKFKNRFADTVMHKNTIQEQGSFFGNGKVNCNWSSIIDKLIRLTAKYTDFFAGDILIDINSIQNELDNLTSISSDMSFLFGFRENGVDHNDFILACEKGNLDKCYRKIYKLDLNFNNENKNNFTLSLYEATYEIY